MMSTTLRLSDSDLRANVTRQGTGEPVVLLHGVGMQSAAWAPQLEELQRTHCVLAIDLPGHGGSDPLPAGSQLDAFVAWCHDAICALDIGPVNLVGHSMGALIAGGYAVTHPDMVRRVALLNVVYCRDEAARKAVIARATEISQGRVDFDGPLVRWFGEDPADIVARRSVADWLSQMDIQSYDTAYSAFAHGDATYAAQMSEIVSPLLALTGEGDPNSTPAMSEAICEQAQNACCAVIEGHRHMVNLTAAETVNAHLQAWLKQPEITAGAQ